MSLENLEQNTYQELLKRSVIPELNPLTGLPLKPSWLKVQRTQGETLFNIKKDLREKKLYTVCEEARCPNISACWNSKTATFMILGDTCTRGCRFCHIKTGNPGGLLDKEEPLKVARTIQEMGLSYAVITMVDRDDLIDGGASHIKRTIESIQELNPLTRVEVLAGDFKGDLLSLKTVLEAGRGLDVFAHNLETVERLTPRVRDARAHYRQSLGVLQAAKRFNPSLYTKSALMLGLGEEFQEVEQSLQDLRDINVEIVTIGQYLQPTIKHLKVKRYVHPDEFEFWKEKALKMGFKAVASGPLVRSSFKASELFPLPPQIH
jgi:lipoic acid synthetase